MPWPKPTCGFGARRDVERRRRVEHRLVAVRRALPDHDLLTGPDLVAAQAPRPRVAVRRFDGDGVVQRSISSIAVGSSVRVGAQRGELVGVFEQGEQPAGDRVARRLRAGGEQQAEERVQLGVGERGRLGVVERWRARRRRACRRWGWRAWRRSARRRRRAMRWRPSCAAASPSNVRARPSRWSKPGSTASNSQCRSISGTPSRMQIICIGSSAATSVTKSNSRRDVDAVEQRADPGAELVLEPADRPRGQPGARPAGGCGCGAGRPSC